MIKGARRAKGQVSLAYPRQRLQITSTFAKEGANPPGIQGNAQKRYHHFVRHQIIPIMIVEVDDPAETKALVPVLALSKTLAVESSQSGIRCRSSAHPSGRAPGVPNELPKL